MYRSDLNPRDKGGAAAAVVAIHAVLLLAFLNLAGKMSIADPQAVLQLFDVRQAPPPPPVLRREQQKAREKEGGSAPKNIKSEATPVVAPKPKIELPPVQKIAAAEIPRTGAQSTQGASDVRGPGTGAGGIGTGTGSGSGGTGSGDGGVAARTHMITPILTGRDFPREIISQWPRRVTVFMRLRIDARGSVSECIVDRGTSVPAIDSAVCNVAYERLHFEPARNRNGQPVADWFGYAQPAPR